MTIFNDNLNNLNVLIKFAHFFFHFKSFGAFPHSLKNLLIRWIGSYAEITPPQSSFTSSLSLKKMFEKGQDKLVYF